jgi:hypothetical protein
LISPKSIAAGSSFLAGAEKNLGYASISEKNHDENTEELGERFSKNNSDRTPC